MMKKMIPFVAAEYAVIALYQSFSSLYFTGQGLSTRELSWVQAAVPLASLLGQPLWGMVADKARRLWVLRGLALAGVLMLYLFPLGKSWLGMALLAGGFAFFQTSIQPIGDAVMLPALNRAREPFGALRMAASLTALVFSLAAGYGFGEKVAFLPWTAAAGMLLTLAASFLLWENPPAVQKQGAWSTLFKNRRFMLLLAVSALLQCTLGFFFCYYAVYFTQDLGGSTPLLGWAYALGALAELPFLLLADRLFARFGPGKMLLAVCLCLSLRWLALAFCPGAVWALITQVLSVGGFVALSFAMAKAASLLIPPELAARAQTLQAALGFALARAVAILAGGWLAHLWSLSLCFGLCAGLCLITGLAFGKFLWKTDFSRN